FFFSYASENYDDTVDTFFEDLCSEVGQRHRLGGESADVCFRDQKRLQMGEKWEAPLVEAVQTSAVLVCLTTPAFFFKPFCGKEHYVFDQRRRAVATNGDVPGVIIPVVWTVADEFKAIYGDVQAKNAEFPKDYWTRGLLTLKKLSRAKYNRCLVSL